MSLWNSRENHFLSSYMLVSFIAVPGRLGVEAVWVNHASIYSASEFSGVLNLGELVGMRGRYVAVQIHRINFPQNQYVVYLLGTTSLQLFDACDWAICKYWNTNNYHFQWVRTWVLVLWTCKLKIFLLRHLTMFIQKY